MTFVDRSDAGRQLARRLARGRVEDAVVLGIPCSGVLVAYEVARQLGSPLDVVVARRVLGAKVPRLAVGAVAEGGNAFLDPARVARLGADGEAMSGAVAREQREVERWAARFRCGREPPPIAGRHVIVVDDGATFGDRARVALRAVRARGPTTVALAVPVISQAALESVRGEADDVVYIDVPPEFFTVGYWYAHCGAASDQDVTALVERSRRERFERRAASVAW